MAIKSLFEYETNSNTVIDRMVVGRNDKRDFIRMSVESTIIISRPGNDKTYAGKTLDLSATGVRFTTQEKFRAGEIIDVVIKPISDITPPLEASVEVVRAEPNEEGVIEVAGHMKPKN